MTVPVAMIAAVGSNGVIGSGGEIPWRLPTDFAPELVFDVPTDKLWNAAYERLGTTPIAFTTRTVGSA